MPVSSGPGPVGGENDSPATTWHDGQPASANGRRPASTSPGDTVTRQPGGAPPVSTRSLGRPGYGVGHRQRTLDPDTMLMSSPEITWPFTRPGERAIFRSGASKVPSTIALQHPVPPPPPEKATCPPLPMMLYSTAPGCTPPATRIWLPPVRANLSVTLMTN